MQTVSDVVRTVILETPFLEEALGEGLINTSALARKLKPRVEAELVKPVSEGALVMALRRLTPDLRIHGAGQSGLLKHKQDLTVRSDLIELTFLRTEGVVAAQSELLHEVRHGTHRFVTFTQGVFEVTLILDAQLEEVATRVFSAETLIARLGNLAAITIRLTRETVNTPGVHYAILKQLALRDINVVEVVSTYTEFTIILERHQVDRAFAVLID